MINLLLLLVLSFQGTSNAPLYSFRVYSVTINGANTDQATFNIPFPKYAIRRITVTNPSGDLGVTSAATIGVFTGAGGTGTTVVTPATITGVRSGSKFADLVLALTGDTLTSPTLTIRTVTSQGSAITVDFIFEITPVD